MLVAQNSLGPVCPVPLTVRGTEAADAAAEDAGEAAGEAVAEAGGTDMAVDVLVFVALCFI